ncbi:hypothetical protein NLO413_0317 [Candidatus Neoehrlichia lotoris str. RAC413]|uniref:Uncharacterized protein n=1 Tax=Candidatus Neoehrlichia procyonis str. RAC413 TaxID=1359163 RepID=A0A0F3NLM2_9RICK|nr:hypothetical protein NLO413_0317 [Candidatus Neoehrlichia lotoris str. RAC413]
MYYNNGNSTIIMQEFYVCYNFTITRALLDFTKLKLQAK